MAVAASLPFPAADPTETAFDAASHQISEAVVGIAHVEVQRRVEDFDPLVARCARGVGALQRFFVPAEGFLGARLLAGQVKRGGGGLEGVPPLVPSPPG